MKVQAFDLLLPFIVACETDCGKKKEICSLQCSLLLCSCFDLLVLSDGLLDLGIVAVVDVAVDILVVVLVFLYSKVVGQ